MSKLQNILTEQFKMDSAHSVFIDQDLQAMEAELYKEEYVELKARQWVPLKSDVPDWAETFAYKLLTGFGRAEFVSPYSDELPSAGLRAEKKVANVEHVGNSFSYSKQDLRAAAAMGMSLDREYAQLQFKAHEELFNATVLLGKESLGFIGFFKHPDVTVLSTTDWDNPATTALQILGDLRAAVNQVSLQSKGVFAASQVILPHTSYLAAQAKPMGADYASADNPLSVFTRTSGVAVGWDRNLETAGVGGTKRMVTYMKSPRVAQCVQPMAPQIGEPQMRGLMIVRPIESRCGGCVVRQPLALVYSDGM